MSDFAFDQAYHAMRAQAEESYKCWVADYGWGDSEAAKSAYMEAFRVAWALARRGKL